MTILSACSSVHNKLTAIALYALESEGLQAPSPQQLSIIVDSARRATCLLAAVAVLPPSEADVIEFFSDFVIRCVNRPAGVGDAAAN